MQVSAMISSVLTCIPVFGKFANLAIHSVEISEQVLEWMEISTEVLKNAAGSAVDDYYSTETKEFDRECFESLPEKNKIELNCSLQMVNIQDSEILNVSL